jgi:CopG family nickel-responsive transcriptional regulator
MPEHLRDALDEVVSRHGYNGRSEVIREACRTLVEAHQPSEPDSEQVIATVTAVFGYDEPEIERAMRDLRHEFESPIRSNAHDCLTDEGGCIETFVLEGDRALTSQFVGAVRAVDERVTVSCATLAVDDPTQTSATSRDDTDG